MPPTEHRSCRPSARRPMWRRACSPSPTRTAAILPVGLEARAGGGSGSAGAGGWAPKAIPEPVQAWRVLGAIANSRFEAAHSARLSSFVGRDQEVGLLYSRWEQAAAGEGQAVLLCGEGGIGKSRIAEQLRHRIAGADHIRVRYQCSPFHV